MQYDTLITIGFLNDNIESRYDEYLNAFDVVITGDASMVSHDLLSSMQVDIFGCFFIGVHYWSASGYGKMNIIWCCTCLDFVY